MRRILLLLCCYFFSFSCYSKQEQRFALVIGNSEYKVSPLKNPVNDSRDMANSLREYGFSVIERNNLTVKQIGSTLREFRSKLTPGSVALVFYAGHGIQIKGENYLPAVDADIVSEEDVPNQSLSTRQIMDVLADAKSRMNLVFLDACRDNPFARSFRSSSRGLGRESAPSGTLISFATRPGSTAADGDGRNGLYTSVLLQQIKNSDHQPIEQILKRLVTGVKTASKGQQEPWMEGSIEGDFCFGMCNAGTAMNSPQNSPANLTNTQTNTQTNTMAASIYQPKLPNERQSFKDCKDCPEMLQIPAGIFQMGDRGSPLSYSSAPTDRHALPQHGVSVSSFLMGKYEVTQEQWQAVMGNLPSKTQISALPVENISWDESQEFVKKLSQKTGKRYRLPTEAEWEYAARGGNENDYPFGPSQNEFGQYAWFKGNSDNKSHPVGEKLPNNFGLYDIFGNVWEWTQDCWNPNYVRAPTDGSAWTTGDCSRRGMRGGSWYSIQPDLNASGRNWDATSVKFPGFGIRVARDN